MRQFARVRDLATADGMNLSSGNSDDRSRLTGESHEFHFVSFVLWINVDDRPDVTGFQSIIGECGGQHDSIMFPDHGSRKK